jgi:hypothetical protein
MTTVIMQRRGTHRASRHAALDEAIAAGLRCAAPFDVLGAAGVILWGWEQRHDGIERAPYVAGARDSTIARFGRSAAGWLRCHCLTCLDEHPLAGYDGRAEPDRVYGDMLTTVDRLAEDAACDMCGVLLADLAARCQEAHDEQQRRWARTRGAVQLVEYGVVATCRCRVY